MITGMTITMFFSPVLLHLYVEILDTTLLSFIRDLYRTVTLSIHWRKQGVHGEWWGQLVGYSSRITRLQPKWKSLAWDEKWGETSDQRIACWWDIEHNTPEKYMKYIRHLQKVLPKIGELKGDATGYWCVWENGGYFLTGFFFTATRFTKVFTSLHTICQY